MKDEGMKVNGDKSDETRKFKLWVNTKEGQAEMAGIIERLEARGVLKRNGFVPAGQMPEPAPQPRYYGLPKTDRIVGGENSPFGPHLIEVGAHLSEPFGASLLCVRGKISYGTATNVLFRWREAGWVAGSGKDHHRTAKFGQR